MDYLVNFGITIVTLMLMGKLADIYWESIKFDLLSL